MRWLWLLYRRPRVFQQEADSRGGKWRVSGIMLLETLPVIYVLTVACMQAFDPKPLAETMLAAAVFLAWKLAFPLAVAAFAIGIALEGDSWVKFGVTAGMWALHLSVGMSLTRPVKDVLFFAVGGFVLNLWVATGRITPSSPPSARRIGWFAVALIGLAVAPIQHVAPPWLADTVRALAMGPLVMLSFFTRVWYWPFALLFVWPKLRPDWYRWHPVAWDDACLVPYWKLDELLAAYARIDPEQALVEMDRIAAVNPIQAPAAMRAKEIHLSGSTGATGSFGMPPALADGR